MEKEEVTTNFERGAMLLNTGKAGMESVNVEKANDIIFEASKGSRFYLRQQEKQQQVAKKINEMREQLDGLTDGQKTAARMRMDEMASDMERSRNLSRVIVHIDMDAFYAAVEMRDDPTLVTKPMAVGGSQMLCTSNYHARKFGVRAGMPGFIAKKLCPDLVIVPLNFVKYRKVSEEVQHVLKEYDPHFCQMGLDEAYLDITHLVVGEELAETKGEVAQQIVREMRQKIQEKTKLTASAGIAANKMLAKICSDMNKPNGQFLVEFDREKIMEFIRGTPIAKVCGIGNVTQQMLNALDVKTCGNISDQRDVLPLLFSELSAESFLRISLGLGSTRVPSEEERKSMSIERTFKDTCDPHELKQKCSEFCAALSNDLKKENLVGKNVTLKLKTVTFHIKTKAKSLSYYTSAFDKINAVAQLLLDQEMKANQSLKLRLMGVRMSMLIDESKVPHRQQFTLDDYLKSGQIRDKGGAYTCPVCEQTRPSLVEITKHIEGCLKTDSQTRLEDNEANDEEVSTSSSDWTCPVCNRTYRAHEGMEEFNRHIDNCLNVRAVKEVLASDKDLYERGQKRQMPATSFGSGQNQNKNARKQRSLSTTTIEKFLISSTK